MCLDCLFIEIIVKNFCFRIQKSGIMNRAVKQSLNTRRIIPAYSNLQVIAKRKGCRCFVKDSHRIDKDVYLNVMSVEPYCYLPCLFIHWCTHRGCSVDVCIQLHVPAGKLGLARACLWEMDHRRQDRLSAPPRPDELRVAVFSFSILDKWSQHHVRKHGLPKDCDSLPGRLAAR